jgi:predicted phosphodiesterase
MKLLCVSDMVSPQLYEHFNPERFSRIDLVISCGDLPPEYLVYLLSTFNVPVYYVRGNHDIRYDNKPPGGCTDLHGRIVRHGPLRILGLEGSRWYNGGKSNAAFSLAPASEIMVAGRCGPDRHPCAAAFHTRCRGLVPSGLQDFSQIDQMV